MAYSPIRREFERTASQAIPQTISPHRIPDLPHVSKSVPGNRFRTTELPVGLIESPPRFFKKVLVDITKQHQCESKVFGPHLYLSERISCPEFWSCQGMPKLSSCMRIFDSTLAWCRLSSSLRLCSLSAVLW